MQNSGRKRKIVFILVVAAIVIAIILIVLFATLRNREEAALEQTPGQASVELGQSEREKWPIIDFLPIKNTLYTLGYTISNNELKLFIDTTDTDLEAAIRKLASLTEQPLANYNITVRSPKNPFSNQLQDNTAENPQDFLTTGYKNLDTEYQITSVRQDDNLCIIELTTGSEEAYNLVHWTVELRRSGVSWELVSDPVPTLLLDL